MVLSRKRPKGVRYYAPFGLSVLMMGLMPRSIGYQDLVALMARQTEVPQRARAHMMASPFGTIHAATFSFPQPVGTLIPEPPRINSPASAPTIPKRPARWAAICPARPLNRPRLDFPAVNRRLKGDLLVTRPREDETPASRHPRSDARPRQDRIVPQTRRCRMPATPTPAKCRLPSSRRPMLSLRCSPKSPPRRRSLTARARTTRRCGSGGSISATASAKASAPSSPGRRTRRC